MTKEAVQALVRGRIAKHKSRQLDDDDDNEIHGDVFNPMDFIIQELKEYQASKKQ
jgi:hypothetical protein